MQEIKTEHIEIHKFGHAHRAPLSFQQERVLYLDKLAAGDPYGTGSHASASGAQSKSAFSTSRSTVSLKDTLFCEPGSVSTTANRFSPCAIVSRPASSKLIYAINPMPRRRKRN